MPRSRAIEQKLGAPEVLVHNAVGGAFGSFMEIEPQVLNRNFQVNTMGLLYLARRIVPAMVAKGKGAIVVTGNTSALRGRANFAGFAPTKAAQRILSEAMARDLGPKGVHVAYIIIDAVIDTPMQRGALQGSRRRLLHQAVGDRRRVLPRRPSGPLGVVVPGRDQAVPRAVVGEGWRHAFCASVKNSAEKRCARVRLSILLVPASGISSRR